jgi:pyridoxal phosphate enzyme (YggS family)
MIDLVENLNHILQRIRAAELNYHRPTGCVRLLAVTKTQAPTRIQPLIAAGQQNFGENYVQEALSKISTLSANELVWHFIGPIQSNKAKEIAQNFSWVHTLSRQKEAQLLSQHRLPHLPPLNICIQVKLDDDSKKSGLIIKDVPQLIAAIHALPGLQLRGLMTLPPFSPEFAQQRAYFKQVRELFEQLNEKGAKLDTLSMGMTQDLEAAIAEGATTVRIGTGLFGPRLG